MAVRMSGITGFHLKMLAMLTMVADHVGAILFPEYLVFRCIGRISFPIFAYLLVEGFVHTRNVQRYMLRLGIFAVLSEIPYDLAFFGEVCHWEKQNIFFTLCLGIGILYVLENTNSNLEKVIYTLFAVGFAQGLRSDYGGFGILLIIWFYLMYEDKIWKLAGAAVWNLYTGISIQIYGVLAVFAIALYNGRQGRRMKYFFYAFYPLHLLALYFVKLWLY